MAGDPTPTITVTPTIGQSVELQCTGAGIKRWYTTGSVVAATGTEVTIGTGATRILALSSFAPSYAGTYSCIIASATTYPVILATG